MYYRGYLPPVECPRCGTLNNQVRDECRFCDCPLENYCEDSDCVNQRNARFCKKCGQPTLFSRHKVFNEAYVQMMHLSAKHYYEVNGDPDTPEAKAEQARRRREARRELRRDSWSYGGDYYDDDDFPEPPTDPDYIPYY